MRLKTIVWREIFERKSQLATGLLSILLGITAIVSIQNVTHFSEKAVARELDALGANILVLPKSASVQGYYSADMHEDVMPEEYVFRMVMSKLEGLDNLSPKLCVAAKIGDKRVTLTGILPKSEFRAKAMWQGAGIFARPAKGCGTVDAGVLASPPPKETLVRKRVIDTLDKGQILLGADAAKATGAKRGGSVEILGRRFEVVAVLPETGTVDDSRAFAHLHTVQKIAGKGAVISAIEVVGCCVEISKGLVSKINTLLPEARVVTIGQVVQTQVRTNKTMANLSFLFLVIIVLVGGASIANYMYANVYERRQEIGTLMALGAGSKFILRLFLTKAFFLGLVGGVGGFALGTAVAVALGPRIAQIPVLPMPHLLLWATVLSLVVALAASLPPAIRAARLDPSMALKEL